MLQRRLASWLHTIVARPCIIVTGCDACSASAPGIHIQTSDSSGLLLGAIRDLPIYCFLCGLLGASAHIELARDGPYLWGLQSFGSSGINVFRRYRLLKMDIEGSEFAVFEDYFERNETLPFTADPRAHRHHPSLFLRHDAATLQMYDRHHPRRQQIPDSTLQPNLDRIGCRKQMLAPHQMQMPDWSISPAAVWELLELKRLIQPIS